MPFKFENLLVWKKAVDLSECVNRIVLSFPKTELFVLASQIKRAADSVSLNIAEGSTGQSNPEFIRFLNYALRSNCEVVGCLYLAKSRKIINNQDFRKAYVLCEEISMMIYSLKKALK
jgi:four helix bundle protein